ncbi:MAG: tetratricopeptide repeat protein [Spirochaetes bacterium]|nr:tetratricopeptide repeat protein [Spirochaetota bacterium]
MVAVLVIAIAAVAAPVIGSEEGFDYFAPDAVLRFARSLYAEGDYQRAAQEFLRYLFLGEGEDREILFLLARCYQRAGEYQRAEAGFQRLVSASIEDEWSVRARYEIAITESLAGEHWRAIELLRDGSLPTLSDVYDPFLLAGWNFLLMDDWTEADEALARSASAFAVDLQALAAKARVMPRKNPALAGFLSAIIPGAGKLYAERPTDALFSLCLIGSLATLSGFAFADEGIGSARGWIYGSLALLFHAGNVHGAVVAARQFNEAGFDRIESQAMAFHDANLW